VLTVDHGLRAGSAVEARKVRAWSEALGVRHEVLLWNGTKPSTGIQAAARKARYDLMSGWCRNAGVNWLLTGHTLDDQAETVLMRLSRTASFESLAGIAAQGNWGPVRLLRPLLDVRRETLRDRLRAIGQAWVDDPSNDNDLFERVRIRKILPVLNEAGLPPEQLAALAKECAAVSDMVGRLAWDWLQSSLQEREQGYCTFHGPSYLMLPLPVQIMVLRNIVEAYGGGQSPERAELERLAAWMISGNPARTLAGALFCRKRRYFLVAREAARINPAPVEIGQTGSVVWDRRFQVYAPPGSVVVPARAVPDHESRYLLPVEVRQTEPVVRLPDNAYTPVAYHREAPAYAEFLSIAVS
jgi:tRNA(Ile)-lysidine synthase